MPSRETLILLHTKHICQVERLYLNKEQTRQFSRFLESIFAIRDNFKFEGSVIVSERWFNGMLKIVILFFYNQMVVVSHR